MKTTQATGLPLKKLILQLNNMNRSCDNGSPNQLFFGRVVRTPGIPTLGREEIDCDKLAERRMVRRERVRELADKGPKPIEKVFAVGHKVKFYDEIRKHW